MTTAMVKSSVAGVMGFLALDFNIRHRTQYDRIRKLFHFIAGLTDAARKL